MSVAGGPSLVHEARAAESTPRNQALQALETPQFLSPPRDARLAVSWVGGAASRGSVGPYPTSGVPSGQLRGVLMCAGRARDVVRR